jgi:hypothetical protein
MMGGGMWGMWLFGILLLVLLGSAAPSKYLRS